MAPAPQAPPYDRNRIREGQPFEGLSRSAPSTRGVAVRPLAIYVCVLVGFRFDKPDFETSLVALRPEPLVMLKVPLRYLMLKLEKYFMDKVELRRRRVRKRVLAQTQ